MRPSFCRVTRARNSCTTVNTVCRTCSRFAGVPADVALRAGGLQYLAMIVLGTAIARRIHARESPAARALAFAVTPAFAAFGGTFMHVQQIAVVTVAGCLLLAVERDAANPPTPSGPVAALVALALPLGILRQGSEAMLYALIAAVIVMSLLRVSRVQVAVASGIVYAVTSAAFAVVGRRSLEALAPDQFEPLLLRAQALAGNAEDVWQRYCELHFTWLGPVSLLLQAPLLLGAGYVLWRIAHLDEDRKTPAFVPNHLP